MSRRTGTILVIVAGAFVTLWALGRYYQRHNLATLAEAEAKLGSVDPVIRHDAAERILLIHPSRADARFVKAEAEIEQSKFVKARQTLDWFFNRDEDLSEADLHRSYQLLIESYLDEALSSVSGANRNAAQVIAGRVEPLLEKVDDAHRFFSSLPGTEINAMLLDARRIDVKAGLDRLKLAKAQLELAKMEGVSYEDQVDSFATQVTQLTASIAALDAGQAELCRQIIEREPGNLAPRRLLFRLWLNRGEYDKARLEAQAMLQLPQLSYALAGEVADRLLNLDRFFAQPTTPRDVELARALFEHEQLTGAAELNYKLAGVSLALHDDDSALAERLAHDILSDSRYRDNTRATCLEAIAMARQGKAADAVVRMQKFNELVTRNADARYALGEALDAMGSTAAAREQWLEAIDVDPMNILPHLAMARSLVDAGYVTEAERYILGARKCNERHPQAMRLYARLIIAKPDPQAVIDLFREHAARQPHGVTWQDAVIVAAMVLDDADRVVELADTHLAQHVDHGLAIFALAWCDTTGRERYEAAALASRAMLDLIDDDPLRWPAASGSVVLDWLPATIDRYDTSAQRPAMSFTPVFDACFVQWSHMVALNMLDAATQRWPHKPMVPELAAELALWVDRPDDARRHLARHAELGGEQTAITAAMRAYLDMPLNDQSPTLAQLVLEDRPTLLWIGMADALEREDDQQAGRALASILAQSPWAEPALLYAMRDAHLRGQDKLAEQWLEMARLRNAQMAVLSECRLAIARYRPDDTNELLAEAIRRDPRSSERRYHVADILARAHIVADRANLAETAFETLVYNTSMEKVMVALWATDVRLAVYSFNGASAMLSASMRQVDLPPRWLDRMLVRAERVMDRQSFESALKMRLRMRDDDAIVQVYLAHLLISQDTEAAEALVRALLTRYPDSPRVLMLKAQLAAAQGRTDDARRIYRQLAASPAPATAEAGQAAIDALDHPVTADDDDAQGAAP